jgi:hypothetical protein
MLMVAPLKFICPISPPHTSNFPTLAAISLYCRHYAKNVSIPVSISVFLINVLRVILTIMHPNSANPAPMGIRRAARAALILIPLFGLQHILIPFRPDMYDPYEHLYQYVTVVIVTLQVTNFGDTYWRFSLILSNSVKNLVYRCIVGCLFLFSYFIYLFDSIP